MKDNQLKERIVKSSPLAPTPTIKGGQAMSEIMDYVELGGSRVVDGIGLMLEAALGTHGYTDSHLVEVPIALLIIEIAKIAEDRDEWFPSGKWATIQVIQGRVERQLKKLFL